MKRIAITCLLLATLLAGCAPQSGRDREAREYIEQNTTPELAALYDDTEKIAAEDAYIQYLLSSSDINGLRRVKTYLAGSRTLWQCELAADAEVTVEYSLAVSSGKAKLVLVTADGAAVTITENAGQSLSTQLREATLPLQAGTNSIKVVAADTAKLAWEFFSEHGYFVW